MAGMYALIRPDGELQFLDGLGEKGDSFLSVATFIIQRAGWGGPGLHGHADAADHSVGAPLFNGTATSVASVLGGPGQRIFGSLIIGGDRDQPESHQPVPCGLTTAQQHLNRSGFGRDLRCWV